MWWFVVCLFVIQVLFYFHFYSFPYFIYYYLPVLTLSWAAECNTATKALLWELAAFPLSYMESLEVLSTALNSQHVFLQKSTLFSEFCFNITLDILTFSQGT